jgi:hypothetical protein
MLSVPSPTLPKPKEKRNKSLHIRLTKRERDAIDAIAKQLNLNPSDMARQLLMQSLMQVHKTLQQSKERSKQVLQ